MGKTKTLGQLSYEVGQDATNEMLGGILDMIPWEDIGPELQAIHEATVQAVRSKVIEDAIEAVKEFHWTLPVFDEKRDNELSDDVAEAITLQIIEALTALKSESNGVSCSRSESVESQGSEQALPTNQTDNDREAE